MAGLKDKLRKLKGQEGVKIDPVPPAQNPDMARQLRRLRPIAPQQTGDGVALEDEQALADFLGGELVAPGLILIRWHTPLDQCHGRYPLQRLMSVIPPIVGGGLDNPETCAWIDTETTGLAGGTGTTAFQIGLLRLWNGTLHGRQWLLSGYAGEAEMLQQFHQALEGVTQLVSFNGKSFDVPLLLTRFKLHGMVDSLSHLSHLDLLHPFRRIFGGVLPDCRLQRGEQHLLGLFREDDLPGSEAPLAWQAWLRGKRGERLAGVLKHNQDDLLSLTLLPILLAEGFATCAHGAYPHAVAKAWIEADDEPRAIEILESQIKQLDGDGLQRLGWLYRRAGRWTQAVIVWNMAARKGHVPAMEDLAKYHEHQDKDLAQAWIWAQRLQQRTGRTPEIKKRINRLRKKRGEEW
ncbi:ribonuclease H-like domain-containing protein [Magnetococcus sp. PR-3]|uniref:ribonuclease H-like domain-containing protein n=1 Tax=Magnetococcus sp. PR-3 TaxID=3120355 RepID=UPI002FCDE90E